MKERPEETNKDVEKERTHDRPKERTNEINDT